MRGAECDTDHMMVRAKLKIFIRRMIRGGGVKIPNRIDVSRLNDPAVRSEIQSAFNKVSFRDADWDSIKALLYQQGVNSLGLVSRRAYDWSDDNSVAIKPMLSQKRIANETLL